MLNKQGEGKIDWCNFTWNPVSGCLHGCEYCYMRRFAKRLPKRELMKPRLHEKRLRDLDKLTKHSKIFVCSSGDLFGDWVPRNWILEVLKVVKKHSEHIFQFLTKNPKRYGEFGFPENCWLGTTIDKNDFAHQRIDAVFSKKYRNLIFISAEPLLEELKISLYGIDWIIIGANSNRGAEKPKKEWADKLVEQAGRLKIPVFIKDNYGYPERHKKFPEARVSVTQKELGRL